LKSFILQEHKTWNAAKNAAEEASERGLHQAPCFPFRGLSPESSISEGSEDNEDGETSGPKTEAGIEVGHKAMPELASEFFRTSIGGVVP
jgi:hypothetical protein